MLAQAGVDSCQDPSLVQREGEKIKTSSVVLSTRPSFHFLVSVVLVAPSPSRLGGSAVRRSSSSQAFVLIIVLA